MSLLLLAGFCSQAQKDTAKVQKDSAKVLEEVLIKGYRTVNGVGHMLELKEGIIYAGKKNEVIITDSLDANKAINNTRQILGRIPGLNIVETESSGFTANGIATRGLNPSQSVEMNTRQNGYSISADVYGYNEAYYLPPMEGVNRIEMVRGAASLQFGPQFGGLVNYVTKDAPANKPLEFNTALTMGSFGLFNSYNSLGGTSGKWSYIGAMQYRRMEGYRPNSQQTQVSGFGKIQYAVSDKLKVGAEYSLLRNKIQMPGGQTDSMFAADPKTSVRARNWLESPWNVVTAYLNYTPSKRTTLSIKSSYLFSSRSLVWRNEDGGPEALDEIDPATNAYVPREVGMEKMRNTNTEIRLSHQYQLGSQLSTIAGGLRYSYSWFKQQGGGEGTTGSDFDLSITGGWGYDFDFTTTNLAPFVENIFRIGEHFTVTPGFRFEYLNSTAKGYRIDELDKLIADQSRNRYIPLFGTGFEYKPGSNTSVYANISQAYRPIEYSQLTPFGVTSKIDPNMKDASGFNADLGYRGTIRNILNFDLGLFYMAYNNRIGVVVMKDPQTGNEYSYRTNIANSVHQGVESYVEFNILKYFKPSSKKGISIFNSFAFIDARYQSGPYKGKRVETAARTVNRIGLVYSSPHLTGTFQFNKVGDAFGDASNAMTSSDPVAGYIPAYTVLDLSGTYKINQYAIKAGVNNLANQAYFTRRTDEYPGPGIIPAVGRSFYIGLSVKL
ncbi:TonB-dependent receptor family protein [Flavihumibacter profundi]|uniref:TonB-dependent receptor family protein n=1 Tax=Flavihumibacter profundi TaxID=2716883 RepID=UPI001CC68211|nr:TonB-dependent receptor [Flavihumibacter profundi]MBZ5857978.1 TonB-dependent receptor [Flavihumibacter profundi]